MKSVIKYFFYIFITGFAITATAQKQQKLEVSSVDSSRNSLPGPISMNRSTESIWDILFSFDVTLASGGSGNGGSEFDGTYYYTTRWASNLIHKYDMTGTLVEEFSIAGVTGLRDLAFDGTFMYGGGAGSVIYQMDFVTKTLIGTIPVTGVTVRHIAYDAGADGFWCGNWADPPTLFDRSGTQLASIVTGLTGQYGSAYDDISVGGPFLWVFNDEFGSGFSQLIHQFDIASGLATGVTHDVAEDAIDPTGLAGGLWTSTDHTPGFQVMGVLVRGVPDEIIVYENPGGPPCPVGEPSNPDPAFGAVDVPLSYPNLSWINGSGAISIEVIFDGAAIYTGVPVTSLPMPQLSYGTSYSWKVNGSNGTCTTLGPIWIFTTEIYLGGPFVEDFDGSWAGTWTITNNGGVCDWVIGPNTRPYAPPGTSGNLLFADSDLCGSGTTMNTTVTMDQGISTVGYTDVILEFAHDFNYLGTAGEQGTVEYSIDGGTTWTVIETFASDLSEVWVSGVIFGLGGQPDVRFRFVYVAPDWDWWWAIDNFFVEGLMGYPPPNAPSDLVAIANAPGQVLLNWQDNSNDELGFQIYRKLGDSLSTNQYYYIGLAGENIITYLDSTVLDTTLYTYKIVAFNGFGFSYSNQAEVLTLIPVELTSFEGSDIDGKVQLKWTTATETNNLGFSTERRQTSNVKRDNNWNKIGFVEGHGTTTEPQNYSFTDKSILSGTYQYRLKQVDYDGSYEYSNIIEVEVGIPTEFSLEQNYPNPFNPRTKIRFSIPAVETGHAPSVRLIVYDVLGNEVATLINEEKEAGIYEVEFSAIGGSASGGNTYTLPSGIYFYRLTAGDPSTSSPGGQAGQGFTATKKMIIIK